MYVYQPEKQTKQGNSKCKSLESIGVLLMKEYKEAIEIHKKVFELPTLKASFIRIAKENGLSLDKIQNRTLTSILHKVWPDIRIIQRPGLSNIVCSESISLNEALQVACRLGKDLSEKYEEDKFVSEISNSDINDKHILHMAAGIFGQRLKTVNRLDKEYFSSDEISLDGQKQFVDKYLLKFLGWVTSEDNFVKSHDINDDIDQDPKLLAICCDLMFAATSVVTPKHLGLTVHLHHLYGSRKLIDALFNLGYTMSYTELRHFLTSAAMHMTNTQRKTPSGALVPSDIKRRDEGGQLILAAGDNWDHNESTADGKRTTHAMTTILVFPKTNKMDN